MTRELIEEEYEISQLVCALRHPKMGAFVVGGCDQCCADTARLVDASPSETTGEFTPQPHTEADVLDEADEYSPLDDITLSVINDQYLVLTYDDSRGTAHHEARYEIAEIIPAPPAGDGVPEVTLNDIELFVDTFQGCADADVPSVNRMLAALEAALSYCATRQATTPCICGSPTAAHRPDCPLVVALAKTIAHEKALDAEEAP